jgi:hypothetical protein
MDKNELVKALRAEDFPAHRKQVEQLREMVETGGIENLHPALRPWVDFNTPLGAMVKHPFVYMHLGGYEMFVKQANDFYAAKIKVRRQYLDNRNFMGYLWSLERPWRMYTLERLVRRKRISLEQLRDILIPIWTDTECPESNQEIPVKLFRMLKFVTDSRSQWKKLPERITVYRGVDGILELTATGPSWTTELKTARIFAYRYGAKGAVYKYTLDKSEALAYIVGRDESEIILDFPGRRSDWMGIEVVEGDDKPEFWPWT